MSAIQLERVAKFSCSRDHLSGGGSSVKVVMDVKEGPYKGLKITEGPFPPGSVPLAGGPQSPESKVKLQYMDGKVPPKPADIILAAALAAKPVKKEVKKLLGQSYVNGVVTNYYAD